MGLFPTLRAEEKEDEDNGMEERREIRGRLERSKCEEGGEEDRREHTKITEEIKIRTMR